MNERADTEQEAEIQAGNGSEPDPTEKEPAGADPLRRWTLITLAVIAALLMWYLAADRFTPFTSQARVDAYVIPIAPLVTGNVTSVGVANNQLVESNDVLLQLDDTQYRFAVNKAQADLESATQNVGASTAGIESATAGLSAARAELVRADKDYNRMQRIQQEDPGAVSQRRLDVAQATLAAAQSHVKAAEAEVERARQEAGRAGADNARIQAAQAALAKAKLDLERTRVLAPGGGLVTDLQVDVGNLASAGQPQMTFVAINDVWIQADMRENNLGHIESGAPVDIALDVQPGRIYKGHVRSIGFGVDSGTSTALGSLPTIENDRNWLRDAQRFPVIVEIEWDDGEKVGLRVGAQATVMVYTDEAWLLKPLGKIYMRLVSLFSYAY